VLRPLYELIKFKLSLAVTVSAALGWYLAPGSQSQSILMMLAGVFLLSGASAALNQVQESKYDARMRRTFGRPIPRGAIHPLAAMAISAVMALFGAALLWRYGWLPMALGLANILLYNALYTPLKRISSFAVIPGGLVGAVPPMIGWTASGADLSEPTIWYIATLMFLWQLPHFWLLTIRYGHEYEAAGFKTLRTYMTDVQIKRMVFFWMTITAVYLLSFPLFGIRMPAWLSILLICASVVFIFVYYILLFRRIDPRHEKWLFILSNVFLIVVMGLMIASSI